MEKLLIDRFEKNCRKLERASRKTVELDLVIMKLNELVEDRLDVNEKLGSKNREEILILLEELDDVKCSLSLFTSEE